MSDASPSGVLAPVRYEFSTTDGPNADWYVRRMQLVEQLSAPFSLELELSTGDVDTDAEALLGASCELIIEREPQARSVFGLVCQLDWLGVADDRLHVRAVVVPALWMCSLGTDSRIFQEMSVPEILQSVLEPRLAAHGRTLEMKLRGRYDARDYCVQYRESDLTFATRLMEEEGIAFHFDHGGEHEVMVLVDANESYTPVQTLDGLAEIPLAHPTEAPDLEYVGSFEWRRRLHTTSIARLDYDHLQPVDPIRYDAAEPDERGREREAYQHMTRRFVLDDGDALAVRERERHGMGGRQGRGQGNVTGFSVGRTFELFDHGYDEVNRPYLITRVIHRGEQTDSRGQRGSEYQYDNTFECIPSEVPYRPPRRTRRPLVEGPQTATVTGPPGEEIHTDDQGRIKIFMHWDRLGSRDDTSSCWVRVAQTWAGPSWGAMFIPRVDMEVLVEFLEGNPDRPLVTGCVYNGRHLPPYPLPGEKTKSTIKTNSSPGGDGYNELRFEDASGAEEVYIHAQRDLNVKVKHDQSTTVDLHQTLQVGGNQKITVDGNQILEIKGAPAKVGKGASAGDNKDPGFKGSSTAVTGDYKVTASSTAFMSAPNSITLSCPGSSITLEPGKITLKAGGGAQIVLDGNALMQSSAGSKVLLDGNALTSSSGGSQVKLDGNALTQSSGGSKVFLDGKALIQASGGGSGFFTADATITGATTTCQSKSGGAVQLTADAAMFGAAAKVMGKGKADVTAPTVNVTGSGAVNVAGGAIKLN